MSAAQDPDGDRNGAEVTPEMVEAGVAALREWIPTDGDRYSGHDHLAVRDVFLRMHELMERQPSETAADESNEEPAIIRRGEKILTASQSLARGRPLQSASKRFPLLSALFRRLYPSRTDQRASPR